MIDTYRMFCEFMYIFENGSMTRGQIYKKNLNTRKNNEKCVFNFQHQPILRQKNNFT